MPELTALVPLDGTKLSESALSLVPFAKSLGLRKVYLVSVWDTDLGDGGQNPQIREVSERGRAYLAAYLDDKAGLLREQDLEVHTVVRVGKADSEILAVASERGADLILIATHGRSGVSRWRLGSVADKVIRGASCPTLVIGPNVTVALATYAPRRILVPLDGSEMAEQALPVARWIAETTGASIDLIRIVQPPTMAADPMIGLYPVSLLDTLEEGASQYLQRVAGELKASRSVTTVVLTGPSAEELIRYEQANPPDLVVMMSHSRRGIARWALGSVTDRVLHGPAPVLVLSLQEEGSSSKLLSAARA